jgi:hypothetical protein
MDWLKRKRVGLMLLMGILSCCSAWAQEGGAYCARNPFNRDAAEPLPIGLTDWHGEQCRDCEFARAGCPQTLRSHATGPNPNFWGYWVGGGTAFGGGPPCEHEGTWGWDFEGWPTRRVWLNWSHGRYQGGTGAYKTDGPKLHLHH